ncbi:MAG: hypothetical protein JXB50_04060 [Spirochaetes bacterium]|nr:hypothetical protein [Spirochaetota bacterium]
MNKRLIIFLLIFVFLSFKFYSNTRRLIGNYIKIEVNDKDGRFLLFARNTKDSEWVPLIFEDYPSTSYFKFYANKVDVNFGTQGYDRVSDIKIDKNKIIYNWKNEVINIKLVYQLISSSESTYADTLIIDLIIENIDHKKLSLDYFFCIDTYLTESSREHFNIQNTSIRSEREITKLPDDFVISTYNKNINIGLNLIFSKAGNKIMPDRVYFSNWKRVEQNLGKFKVVTRRPFNLDPYSYNDSAMFIEYSSQKFNIKEQKQYRFILSTVNKVLMANRSFDSKENIKVENIYDKDINTDLDDNNKLKDNETDSKKLTDFKLHKNLSLLNLNLKDLLELLDIIDKKLISEEKLSDNDVDMVEQILAEIKKRRNIQ